MVKCEGSPLCYSKRWRLFSRLAGDASLLLSMTYAWGGEILRGFTPQNDKQMSFRMNMRNPRLLLMGDSSGLYTSEWQRIARAATLCHSERTRGIPCYLFEILHYAYATFRMTSHREGCIAWLCHSEPRPMVERKESLYHPEPDTGGVRDLLFLTHNGGDCSLAWVEMLRYRSAWQTLGRRFFLPTVVRMTGIGKGFFKAKPFKTTREQESNTSHYSSFQPSSSAKFFRSGFSVSIRRSFFVRRHPFISFSRSIASSTNLNSS